MNLNSFLVYDFTFTLRERVEVSCQMIVDDKASNLRIMPEMPVKI